MRDCGLSRFPLGKYIRLKEQEFRDVIIASEKQPRTQSLGEIVRFFANQLRFETFFVFAWRRKSKSLRGKRL